MRASIIAKWSRRAMVVVGPLAVVFVLGGTGHAATARLERELVIVTTGGTLERALKEHFYEPFSRATGVTVRAVTANDADQWAKVKAMSSMGNVEWDIVSLSDTTILSQRAFLSKIDCDALPNVAAEGVRGACQEYGLLRTIGGNGIVYSTRAFAPGKGPRTWADFWDVKRFPGPRALPNHGAPWQVLAAALLADGVPADKLFPMDVDRAFRKLDEIKPHVKVWWKSGDQSQQIIRDGEVALSMMWSGRAFSLKNSGVPIEVEWNQSIRELAYWGILRGAPHPEAARAFLDYFMTRPEAHLAFSKQIVYDTANRRAQELVPEVDRSSLVTFDRNWSSVVALDFEWVAKNRAALLERWNAWIAR